MTASMTKSWQAVSQSYLGKKWNAGGFACYDLVRAMYHDALGIHLPLLPRGADAHTSMRILAGAEEQKENWQRLEHSEPGAVVTMSLGRIPHHCGVYVGQQFIAHVYEAKMGVMLSRPAQLAAEGFNICGYYKWIGEA